MSDIRLVIAGAAGRMGLAVFRTAAASQGIKAVAGLEAPGHKALGQDMGRLSGGDATGVLISDDPLPVLAKADALIDFTAPKVSVALADLAAQARIVHVLGTTGLSEDDDKRIAAAARHATIIKSGSFSLGINLLVGLVELAARSLGPDFDAEILEIHHRMKVDAPSGTALLLGNAAARGRDAALKDLRLRPNDGITGPRAPGKIGFASLRGGSVIGDHAVMFAGDGERVEIWHRSEDRTIFARGALRAALWGQGKGPGLFDMQDVLGLRARG